MINTNVIFHNPLVTRKKRQELNRHKSLVVWFTGLSGAGKSTLAHLVEDELHKLGTRTFVLDGDNVRHGLSSNLKFNDEDRKENIRRIGEVAKLMMEAGIITMTALISPFREDRNFVRQLIPKNDFIEIFCKASIKTCETRDVKGIYKKARSGIIKDFTGISSPYEEPENPELIIDTEKLTTKESVSKILYLLKTKITL
jgi:adenylylsulfate kinase